MTDNNNEKTVYIVEGYEDGLNAIKISDVYGDKKDAEELLKKWTNCCNPWSTYSIWERKLKLKKDSENSEQIISKDNHKEIEKDLESMYDELDKIFTSISGLPTKYYLGSKTQIIESLNKIKQALEMFKSEMKDEKEGIYD